MSFYSSCCGYPMPMWPDSDICPDCKEHTDGLCECEFASDQIGECDGFCDCTEKCKFCYPKHDSHAENIA